MTRGLPFLLLALAACGRTGLVDYPPVPVEPAVVIPAAPDGGNPLIVAGTCTGTDRCPRGFHCEAGVCVLNGNDSLLQVTLQWQNDPRTADDLDLHLVEPRPVSGTCEIYFGTGSLFTCEPVGKLDLDANGACIDTDPAGGPGADTENIIYPPDRSPPSGHYIVRVDYWAECTGSANVPFVVTVRNRGVVSERRGVFHAGESDSGEEGSGVTMMEFDVP